mmetsp:Transcript_3927/g.8881  ORF Transcript_3927/g.8881 Transcript_3927/m.8881 type:complete len:256 (+) Transcript_3927:250-1017(+)
MQSGAAGFTLCLGKHSHCRHWIHHHDVARRKCWIRRFRISWLLDAALLSSPCCISSLPWAVHAGGLLAVVDDEELCVMVVNDDGLAAGCVTAGPVAADGAGASVRDLLTQAGTPLTISISMHGFHRSSCLSASSQKKSYDLPVTRFICATWSSVNHSTRSLSQLSSICSNAPISFIRLQMAPASSSLTTSKSMSSYFLMAASSDSEPIGRGSGRPVDTIPAILSAIMETSKRGASLLNHSRLRSSSIGVSGFAKV